MKANQKKQFWVMVNFLIIHTDALNFEVPLRRTCWGCAFLSIRSRRAFLNELPINFISTN